MKRSRLSAIVILSIIIGCISAAGCDENINMKVAKYDEPIKGTPGPISKENKKHFLMMYLYDSNGARVDTVDLQKVVNTIKLSKDIEESFITIFLDGDNVEETNLENNSGDNKIGTLDFDNDGRAKLKIKLKDQKKEKQIIIIK